MSFLSFLEKSVSIIFFTNKILVLAGKKSGWLIGAVAAALASVYFLLLDLKIYVILEFGLVILMGYGFFKQEERNQRVEDSIRVVLGAVMLLQAIFVFEGSITVIEFASSIGMLVGTYLLTHDGIRLGWAFYAIAHIMAAYLGYAKEQQFFADLQIASAIVCAVGSAFRMK